jgi:hypothetical protein
MARELANFWCDVAEDKFDIKAALEKMFYQKFEAGGFNLSQLERQQIIDLAYGAIEYGIMMSELSHGN